MEERDFAENVEILNTIMTEETFDNAFALFFIIGIASLSASGAILITKFIRFR